VKLGDLVKTVEGYSHQIFYGIIINIEASEDYVQLHLTEKTSLGKQTHWFRNRYLEVISEAR
jgi:hypothetical protein